MKAKYPKYFNWLRIFPFARKRCLICNELEPKKRTKINKLIKFIFNLIFFIGDLSRPFHFMSCFTPTCEFVHCENCWFDIGEICLGCSNNFKSNED